MTGVDSPCVRTRVRLEVLILRTLCCAAPTLAAVQTRAHVCVFLTLSLTISPPRSFPAHSV